MDRKKLLENIIKAVETFYGSLTSPNYSEIEKSYDARPYMDSIKKLEKYFQIEEVTDLNDDVAVILSLVPTENSNYSYRLELSLVGRFAALFKIDKDRSTALTRQKIEESQKDLLHILEKDAFTVIPPDILKAKIPFYAVNSEGPSTVYQALFSDLDLDIL